MVTAGLHTLVHEQRALVAGRRIGLLAHPPSVDVDLRTTCSVLQGIGAEICCLFGPEHGVGGEAQDMVSVASLGAPGNSIPVYSLYGADTASLKPCGEWLESLQAVVIDLQDVGSRYYTYVWTMVLMMEACAEAGVAVVIVDRPNPISGASLEGPGIDDAARSFVGLHSVPVRHGLTAGELARLVAAEQSLDVELHVVPMRGWQRTDYYDDTALPWVLPSPNMPTLATALVYPGGCLLEGTNVSEGRGTTRPFEIFGAPWIDGQRLAAALSDCQLAGVGLRPLQFRPTFQKHGGEICGGLQLHVTQRPVFRPLYTGVAVLWALRRLWPEQFAWRTDAYEFVVDRPAIDLLAGGAWLREGIDAGVDPAELCAGWPAHEREFEQRRQPYLLY